MDKKACLFGEIVEGGTIVIPSGKIKCFITGKLRKDTPEERIRQDVARSLVEEYGTKMILILNFQLKWVVRKEERNQEQI